MDDFGRGLSLLLWTLFLGGILVGGIVAAVIYVIWRYVL